MSDTTVSEMHPTSQSELIECYEEPICTPGSIQPHGVLLVLKESDLTIIQTSANTDTVIGIQPHDLLGNTLDLIVDSLQIDYLRDCLAYENVQDVSPCALTLEVRGKVQAFEGSIHRVDGVLVLELEPASPEDTSFSSVYRRVRQSVGRFQNILGLKKLCRLAARELQVLTGFDRVMIYSFDPEWNGA
ncbi:MAG: hypothetical protein H7Y22_05685, partial [Gemmatimonadaceae bacterium]|nr:hypothetical protein [Gloeobacterales cyanobacterium ES-bin-141]